MDPAQESVLLGARSPRASDRRRRWAPARHLSRAGSKPASAGIVTRVMTWMLVLAAVVFVAPPALAGEVAAFSVSHYAPDVPLNGPIGSVSVLPGNDRVVAAAGDTLGSGGVFTSTNGGASWSHEDRLAASKVQSLAWVTGEQGQGWGCPCLIATAAPDMEASEGGGVYVTNNFLFPPHGWGHPSGIFPASPSCDPQTRAAYDIAIAPDAPSTIYIGTDCGIAIGTPRRGGAPTFTTTTIPGAADQRVESLVALPGGRLIAGGPLMGVWSYDGVTWTRATGLPAGGDGVFFVHAFAADPRGGNRAYAETETGDRPLLSETWDGGATWHRVGISLLPWSQGCGGIPNVHATVQDGALHLFAGDECSVYTAVVPLGAEPAAVLHTGDWTALAGPHGDTWDLAFHSTSRLPYLLSSDGGVAVSGDGTTFRAIGPAAGLNSLEVTEVDGELPLRSTTPDLYFATWHDNIYSMVGTSASVADVRGAEGLGLGMPAAVTAGAENQITLTTCNLCHNFTATARFRTSAPWPDAEPGVSNPTFVSPGRYVQAVDRANTLALPAGTTSRQGGLALTTNDGSTWRQIVRFADQLTGLPKVSGPPSDPTLTQPYLDATPTSNGQRVVKLLSVHHLSATGGIAGVRSSCPATSTNCTIVPAMRGFGGLGVTPANMPWYEVYAVDPNDPNRIIAPDVIDGTMKRTINGGDDWTEIPGLADLVTDRGAYRFSLRGATRSFPDVSAVSICPWNSDRVLLGTRQGGAFSSLDGGTHWAPVTSSAQIRLATSIYWLPGCASAYMATFGRGIFRIDIQVTSTLPAHGCEVPICRIERIIIARLGLTRVPPRGARLLIATDGYITSLRRRGARTSVSATAGSILLHTKTGPAVRSTSVPPPRTPPRRIIQAVLIRRGHRARIVRGPTPLRLYPLARTKTGRGRHIPARPSISIVVHGAETIAGTAESVIAADAALTATFASVKPTPGSLLLRLDGRPVAEYPAGEKGGRYVDPVSAAIPPGQLLGVHQLELVTKSARPKLVASTVFAVANGDSPEEHDGEEGEPTSLSVACPAVAPAKAAFGVGGTLTPGFAGGLVTITYTEPNATIVDTATTDELGNYADSIQAESSGTWTIQATFGGDPNHQSSQSAACTTQIGTG